MSKRISMVGIAVIMATLLSSSLMAQQLRGTVSGTVTDEHKALVPGVTVKLTHQEKGVVQTSLTNESGVYRLTAVDPGRYSIEFTKQGFDTQKAGSIEVQSGKETTVDALELKVGVVSTQVFVTVPGMELDKAAPSVRLNLPGKILDEIPLSTSSLVPAGSRNYARYALFTPGIVRVLYQNETSANGHRGRENNYMLDGTDNNDQTVSLPALFIPPEAIQEVDVQANTFSAEYGRAMGAQVNVITKSGTNAYRGELWEFYRGNALEPLSLTSRIAGLPQSPRLVDNQFGGTFGGPVFKDRTFFFGMVQANLLRTGPRPQGAVTIPTPAGYAALQTVPLRSAPVQSAESRQAMLDALSFLPSVHSTIQNYDSTSITSINGTDVEMGTFRPVIPTYQNVWNAAMRMDHNFSITDRVSYRGHIDRRISPLSQGNLRFGDRFGADSKYFGQNHYVGYTKTINTQWVNEARVSYARLFPSFQERDPITPTSTITGLFQIGGNSNFPDERLEQTYQFQNVSTYLMSRHALKFGVDIARTRLQGNTAPNSKGTWAFTSLANFMNSQPTSLTFLATSGGRYNFHQLRQAYFVQDDFKFRRNLTLNIGLRYETSSIPLGFFGSTLPEVLNAVGQGPVQRDTNNWAPRIGFAYSPEFGSGFLGTLFGDGKSAIRGGFGTSYDVLFYSLAAQVATQSYPWAVTPQITGSAAMDLFPVLPPTTPTLTSTTTLVNITSDAQNPTSHYWSLSVQRQIRSDVIVELGYNGNRSYHLIRQGQGNFGVLSEAKAAAVIAGCTSANLSSCQDPVGFPTSPTRIDPNWGSRILLETTGNGAYHGMYLQVSGRMPFGLRVGANYTWSANLSDSDEFSNDSAGSTSAGILDSTSPQPQNFQDRRNEWSRSAFDRPHRFTVNYSYEIPGFRSSNAIINQAVNGWQVSGFTEVQSGQPFTIRIGMDALGAGASATSLPARPDYNPDGVFLKDPVTGNLRTFTIPLDGTGIVTAPHVTSPTGAITFLKNSMPNGGTLGRNTFRGPGYANFNMSLAKRFVLPGDRQLQLRGDLINVFNHDNFPNPDGIMSSSTFGKQKFQPLTDARQVLLGVKLSF